MIYRNVSADVSRYDFDAREGTYDAYGQAIDAEQQHASLASPAKTGGSLHKADR